MIKNLIPSISKKIISQCKYHSISMIREDKFLDGLDTVLNKLSNVGKWTGCLAGQPGYTIEPLVSLHLFDATDSSHFSVVGNSN